MNADTEMEIGPMDLRSFLKSRGWSPIDAAQKERLFAFEHPSFARRQLIFPMDSNAPDYSDAVAGMFAKLADLTGEPISWLRTRARFIRDDVLRLRIQASASNTTELPIFFAEEILKSTVKLLKAAACTVLMPRARHPKLFLKDAVEFVNRSRFGQTAKGSFILQVACPLHAVEAEGTLPTDDPAAPFTRQVTTTVQRSLRALTTAIEDDRLDGLIEEMRDSSTPLLSSNLCEAVAGMYDESTANSLDVDIDWSPLRPVQEAALRHPIRIQRDYFPRIQEVQQRLRAADTPDDGPLPFIGTVERLLGDMNPDGRRSGEVLLSLLLPDEDEAVRARVVLSAEDYRKADQAHMTNNAYIRVVGRLRQGRQPRQMTDVSRFDLIDPTTQPS